MFVVVGLGNPGREYAKSRHNIGFMTVDFLAEKHKTGFSKARGPYNSAVLHLANSKIILVKPLTYMNLSGRAVQSVLQYYQVEDFSKILVISDDIDLPFGTIRLRPGGSDGGQKGLRSIISYIGTQEFPRLRVGIGNNYSDAARYVLSSFSKKEREDLPLVIRWASDAVESFLTEEIELTMSRFNRNVLMN